MAEYSQDYSRDVAFTGDYPDDNTPSGSKQLKVGSTLHMYDESIEDDHSAVLIYHHMCQKELLPLGF